jgi:trehalose 6-phosphate synthase
MRPRSPIDRIGLERATLSTRGMGMPIVTETATCWTAGRLQEWLVAVHGADSIVVLANREPFRHDLTPEGGITVRRSGGGLVSALEPLMEASRGIWVAHGSGTADRIVVDRHDGLAVPPANPSYRLRRVWLDAREEQGYYYGFANEGLWPLCHRTPVRPIFRAADFHTYHAVNSRFAAAVCDEVATERPLVLVQDYHFALAPRMLHERLPRSTIVSFWHIPWPRVADLAACPWHRQLLHGVLGSSIVGLQTDDDRRHFIDCAEALLNAEVDRTHHVVRFGGVETLVRVYPVSVEHPNRWTGACESVSACRTAIRRQLALAPDALVGVGVDRLDYTKGLPEKFLAVERLLESRPEFRNRFVFVQIAEPSRSCLPAYRELRTRVQTEADRINQRFGGDGYKPIELLEMRQEPADVFRFLRGADLCYVGSLHDGMNLVAKEFVSARDDERGVLLLSTFAGAARELSDALVINPYDRDAVARALGAALTMSDREQSRRMRRMRSVITEFNTFRWAAAMLGDAVHARRRGKGPHSAGGARSVSANSTSTFGPSSTISALRVAGYFTS